MINTKKVTDRRQLRFESVDDVIRDAEALVEAEGRGTLRQTGNWSLGQALGHVAFWASAPFDGYPEMPTPPWIIRRLMLLFKKRLLHKGMPAGISIRGVPGGTFGFEPQSTEAGLAAVQCAFRRLEQQCPAGPNPMFGPMTHQEWRQLNLRHAELHLSFFHPA